MKKIFFIIWFCSAATCFAGEPGSAPSLRLNTEMHNAAFRRLWLSPDAGTMVSCSDDKTIRVWNARNGQLTRVIRVPIGSGFEGKLTALDISADGKTIACGGSTGLEWDGNASIYLFDLQSGKMRQRIPVIERGILRLRYLAGGKWLAVLTKSDDKGDLYIYRTEDGALMAQDSEYGTFASGLDADNHGRLVTASWDGMIRLYGKDFKLIAKKKCRSGKQAVSASFSPSGDMIAVTYLNTLKVDIYSGSNLSHIAVCKTGEKKGQGGFGLKWSMDGERLYASMHAHSDWIGSWDSEGRNYRSIFPVDEQSNPLFMSSIMDLAPTPEGGLVACQGVPSITALNSEYKVLWHKPGDITDFREIGYGFRVNQDASIIEFRENDRYDSYRFDFNHRALLRTTATISTDLEMRTPKTWASDYEVTGYEGIVGEFAQLNGKRLTLDTQEIPRSLCIAPDEQRFVLGTEYFVRLFDQKGQCLWKVEVPIAWDVNVSGDGRTVVAALSDGTIRWYRLRDGKELLALFVHRDKNRWIAWTPKGYYDAGPGADELVGWHINQGKDQAALFYPLSRFSEQFYDPTLVHEALLSCSTDEEILSQAGRRAVVDTAKQIRLPPAAKIVSPYNGQAVEAESIEVVITATDQGGGIDEIRLYHNGKAVGTETRDIKVVAKGSNQKEQKFQVTLVEGDNHFRAIALSKDRIESNPDEITVILKGAEKQAILHLITVGINQYKNQQLNLNYAQPDAQGILSFFSSSSQKLFKQLKKHEIFDSNATKPSITAKLQELQSTPPQDVVIIYLAGHGDSIENTWYFIPYDVVYPEKEEEVKTNGLSSIELQNYIKNIGAQKVLVLMDACKSGASLLAFAGRGLEDRKALSQLARAAGVHVVAASTKDQIAAEVKDLGHGVFTHTLLQALKGEADGSPKDGTVTVRELLSYIENKLPEISQKYKTQAQYPVVDSRGMDFPISSVK